MRTLLCGWLVLLATVVLAEPDYRADRIIVKPKPGVATAQLHAALHARVHRQFARFDGVQVLTLPRGLTVEKAIARYRRSGLFEYVQPDYLLHIAVTPDDLYFTNGTLYGMTKISAPAAWDTRTDATNVIVAVIDTGARLTHEDLVANIWSNPCVSCPVNGIVYTNDFHGINAITETGNPTDDNSHGSHCAGIIGGVGNNGKGVVGVAWHVQIMPLKSFNAGGNGFTSDAIEAVNYAAAKGAHIVSCSWGGGGDSPALRDAIAAARSAGIIFVFAAGNNGSDNEVNPFYPAAFEADNLVAVASTDSSDNRSSFSNYGRDSVDLGAPGSGIFSTVNSSDSAYAFKDGTSMATPHVAGALALVKAQFFSESYTQLIQRVLGNVDLVTALSNRCVTGGRLNLANALTNTPRPVAEFTFNPRDGAPPLNITFTNRTLGTTTNLTWNFGDGSPLSFGANPTHTFLTAGTFNVTLTAYGLPGIGTRIKTITLATNYTVRPAAYNWIDPTGMTPLSLSDDSVSGIQTIPFSFVFYEQTNTGIYVGSNGILGFDPSGMNGANYDPPKTGGPNNFIAPLWTDFNPGVGGQVYVGTTGTAPHQVFVVSWVNVPNAEDTSAVYSVQAQLHESSHLITFHYQNVAPSNTSYGAGGGSTVAIENSSGTVARKLGDEGTSLPLTNGEALAFLWPSDDADGDGLPNSWEISYGLDPLTADANADADGDGTSNADEFAAGTSPIDPASRPRVQSVAPGSVTVPSVIGKTYRLQTRDSMDTGSWTDVSTNLTGDGSVLTLTDTGVTTQRFYRVKITP